MTRGLSKGDRIEITPYGNNAMYEDLGWLDGKQGEVTDLKDDRISVKVNGTPYRINLPVGAVRQLFGEREGKA